MTHILVAGAIHPKGMAVIEAQPGVTFEVVEAPTADDLRAKLPGADALVIRTAPLPADAVEAAARLRVVARHGVGYDNIPLDALTARGIPLALVGSVNAVTVAEHALFMMFALAKQGRAYDRAVRTGDWAIRNSFAAVELTGRTLLILGFGRVGRELARRALGLDMAVHAYDPLIDATTIATAGAAPVDDWRDAIGYADFVSLHLPRTPETTGMIGAGELATMRPGAFLINTARGGLIDEAALAAALSRGAIAGAGIDVFDDEPPAADHPLFGLDNVLLSPHAAGLTMECATRMGVVSAENALAGLAGQPGPALVVNREVLA